MKQKAIFECCQCGDDDFCRVEVNYHHEEAREDMKPVCCVYGEAPPCKWKQVPNT